MKTIIINSAPRTGNTFLSDCLDYLLSFNNIKNNFNLYSHLHDFKKLSNNEPDSFTYTILREPIDVITSSVFHAVASDGKNHTDPLDHFKDRVAFNAIERYSKFLTEMLIQEHVRIILFNNLISKPHNVLDKIMIDLGVEQYKRIRIEDVKESIAKRDETLNKNLSPEHFGFLNHLPHAKRSIRFYNDLESFLKRNIDFINLQKQYDELLLRINMINKQLY
jgi:hypothetical protein